jgi:hypothetical protein
VSSFMGIQGKIWECINGWKGKFLSHDGSYSSNPYVHHERISASKNLMPGYHLHDGKVLWGHKENDERIAWMSWKNMGKAKEIGGLGFRDLEFFNLALLAKQGWRLIQNPDSLVAKIMMVKYYPNSTFLEASIGRKPSYAWRSIWNSRKLLTEGLIWRVGDGKSIRIWEDLWLPRARPAFSPVSVLDRNAKKSVSYWMRIRIGGTWG